MPSTVDRKLTTILCADVVGYSRLMEQDEEATLHSLKKTREIFATEFSQYSGRLINMTGDGIIADFSSVVKAVHCAVSIQTKLQELKLNQPKNVPLSFRIGLNLGDVIIEGNDIFGDGVNIASRLESLAPKDGICISGTVYDHVKGKFPIEFKFLGEKQVKNIKTAVPVYSLEIAGSVPTVAETVPSHAGSPRPKPDTSLDNKEEKIIRKLVKRQAAFYRRCIMMGCLLVFLFLINILTSPSYLWVIWPALPILFMLAMDALRVFGKGRYAEDWEERKFTQMKEHRRKKR